MNGEEDSMTGEEDLRFILLMLNSRDYFSGSSSFSWIR